MSSVNGSDNQNQKNRYEETIRRQREDSQRRESEIIKKHNKELRRISEVHQTEVDKIREDHGNQMNEYGRRARSALTVKDKHYQNEIANMKKLHTEQYAKIKEDHNLQLEATRDANKRNNRLREDNNEKRFKELNEHYNHLTKESEENTIKRIEKLRGDQGEALAKQREKLNTAHEEEVSGLSDLRMQQNREHQRAYDELRQTSASRIKQQETRHLLDKQRISDAHMSHIRQNEIESSDNANTLRKSFEEGLDNLRYEQAVKERNNRDSYNKNMLELKADANQNMNEKVGRLENNIREIQFKKTREKVNADHQKSREINALKEQFHQNVLVEQDKNQLQAEAFKKQNRDDIRDVRKEMSDVMKENTKFYQRQIEVDNFKNRHALDNIKSDFESRSEQADKIADMRIHQARENASAKVEIERERNSQQIEMLRSDNEKEKLDMSLKLNQNKNQALTDLKKKMQKMQTEHDLTLARMKSEYDKKLAEMHQKHTVEKAQMRNSTKHSIDDLQRVHDTELTSVKMRYENKLQEMNNSHKKEIQRVNVRHEQQLDDVISTFNKA
ncbi:MAG: hypothetical protein KDD58_07420 [Bdellovibrionales bacterium]|nr:hypothetical protein [Bdellovibrionales bacterium]